MQPMTVFAATCKAGSTLNVHWLKCVSEFLLWAAGAGRFDVSLFCVGRRKIQHFNRTYRKVDKQTDVLSFPYHEVRVQWSFCSC